MTVPTSKPTHDTGVMLRALLDDGYRVILAQSAGGTDYYADLIGPFGSQATGFGDSPAAALASVWPLDGAPPAGAPPAGDTDEPGDDLGPLDATAAAVLAAKLTALREYVGRVLTGEDRDQGAALKRVAADLGRLSVILAAATEGAGDEYEDQAEAYCSACGQRAGIFHGYEGWRHYRGEGTAASPTELYDAGHEVAGPVWCLPPGRSLTPADMTVIRDALADAYAAQWHRDGTGSERAAAYAALLDSISAADFSGGAL